jgi:hypothetical protein
LEEPSYLRVVAAQGKILPTQVIIKLGIITLVLVVILRCSIGFAAESSNLQAPAKGAGQAVGI